MLRKLLYRTKMMCLSGLMFTTLCSAVQAERVELQLGLVRAGGQGYFVDLLQQSLESQGHEVVLTVLGDIPQKRMLHMIEDGQLTLTWLVQSKERDQRYVPVEVGITNGLIGYRIMLIPKGMQATYDGVETLQDFRSLALVGVFGDGWFDSRVWALNKLKYIEKQGNWQSSIYDQIAAKNRGIDYFSRGFFEVVEEADLHPLLVIEENLMLIYDRDFRFYLGPKFAALKPVLTESLLAAQQSGLMAQLIKKHWADSFQRLRPDERRKIYLATPTGG